MIKMKKSDYETILAHAKKEAPLEACGLIAGHIEGSDKFIDKIYILTNIDHAEEHFSLDPKEQLEAVRDMRKNGLKTWKLALSSGFTITSIRRRQAPCI